MRAPSSRAYICVKTKMKKGGWTSSIHGGATGRLEEGEVQTMKVHDAPWPWQLATFWSSCSGSREDIQAYDKKLGRLSPLNIGRTVRTRNVIPRLVWTEADGKGLTRKDKERGIDRWRGCQLQRTIYGISIWKHDWKPILFCNVKGSHTSGIRPTYVYFKSRLRFHFRLFQLRGVGSQRSTNESSESATGEFECHPEPSLTNSFQEPTYQTIEKALFVGDNSSESDHALPDPEQEDLDEIYAARHGDRQRPPLWQLASDRGRMQGVSSPSVHSNTATKFEPQTLNLSPDRVTSGFPLERSTFSRLSTDELSLTSEQRRVSFNSDISVKRIPKPRIYKTLPLTLKRDELESGPFASAVRQEPPTSEKDIASEARLILTQLEGVQCSVSPTPNSTSSGFGTPTRVPQSVSSVARSASCGAAAGGPNNTVFFGPSQSKVGSSQSFHSNKRPILNSNASCSSAQSCYHPPHRPLWKQSSEHLEQHHQQRKIPTQTGSKFITNRTSSGGSASNEDSSWQSSGVHSATEDSYRSSSLASTLSRCPPREDDLTSHLRREQNSLYGLHALNNLDIAVNGRVVNSMPSYQEIRRQINLENSSGSDKTLGNQSPQSVQRNQVLSPPKPPRKSVSVSPIPPEKRSSMEVIHYAQPVSSRNNTGQSAKMVSSVMEQLSQDAKFRRGMMANSAMEDDDITSTMTSSYSSQNVRRSPTRNLAPSPSRISPSRTCMTDTELLRSPTEVLYAVSDKHKHHHNDRLADSASQTIHNDIHPRYHQPPSHHHRSSRASSREDLLSDVPSSYRNNSELNNRVMSRSADPYRYRDDDKENNFKARIQVVSPDRVASVDRFNRKPYKTTINTATDNIQYRGNTLNNKNNSNLYQKNHHHSYRNRSSETEHYKVPKNKAPVEYFGNGSIRPASVQSLQQYHDSDQSSINPYNGQSRFASTRLVKNADTVNSKRHHSQHHLNGRELDREGRTIRRSTEARGRTYSGCSTSPDREESPDRYSKPKAPPRSYSYIQNRSPSSSPTRPPRSRSSPAKEIIGNVIRRATNHNGPPRQVERTPSNRAQTSIRNPMKDIRRVHNDFRREHSSPSIRATEESEDRLAKFTEYRGDDSSSYNQRVDRRGSSVAYDHRRRNDDYSSVEDRERGQSLPPGATIDSIRDFYKSSQFKSMYALPPSPSRPAPVLDRAPSTSTLNRRDHSVGRSKRPNRVSISEGEITDDTNRIGSLHRPRPPKVMNSAAAMGQPGSHRPIPPARKQSTKRQAPSPPGQPRLIRRVVSSDRDERGHHGMTDQMRRVASADRGLQHPPARKPLGRQTSMGEPLDSSFSESDGLIPEQVSVRGPSLTSE